MPYDFRENPERKKLTTSTTMAGNSPHDDKPVMSNQQLSVQS